MSNTSKKNEFISIVRQFDDFALWLDTIRYSNTSKAKPYYEGLIFRGNLLLDFLYGGIDNSHLTDFLGAINSYFFDGSESNEIMKYSEPSRLIKKIYKAVPHIILKGKTIKTSPPPEQENWSDSKYRDWIEEDRCEHFFKVMSCLDFVKYILKNEDITNENAYSEDEIIKRCKNAALGKEKFKSILTNDKEIGFVWASPIEELEKIKKSNISETKDLLDLLGIDFKRKDVINFDGILYGKAVLIEYPKDLRPAHICKPTIIEGGLNQLFRPTPSSYRYGRTIRCSTGKPNMKETVHCSQIISNNKGFSINIIDAAPPDIEYGIIYKTLIEELQKNNALDIFKEDWYKEKELRIK